MAESTMVTGHVGFVPMHIDVVCPVGLAIHAAQPSVDDLQGESSERNQITSIKNTVPIPRCLVSRGVSLLSATHIS